MEFGGKIKFHLPPSESSFCLPLRILTISATDLISLAVRDNPISENDGKNLTFKKNSYLINWHGKI